MKMNKARRSGYLSFDICEVKRLSESDSPNAEAYGYLYQAVTTKPGTPKGIDDAYPQTAQETAQMQALLQKAKDARADKGDSYFDFCIADLESVLDWSSRRHWNFQWQVILGVVLTLLFLSWRADRKQKDVDMNQELVTAVEAWAPADTTLNWDETPVYDYDPISAAMSRDGHLSPISYKLYNLYMQKHNYVSSMEYAEGYAARADTASTAESRKNLEKLAEESRANAREYREEFDRINGMDFKEIQEMALHEYGVWVKSADRGRRAVRGWTIFFIILIPLYIFAERPYGYTITRTRAESETLSGISKLAFALGAMMYGSASAIPWVEKIVTYSNGHTAREQDAGENAPVILMKIILYGGAFVLICVVSCLLMIYMTAVGLWRNYDWTPVLAKAKAAVASVKTSGTSSGASSGAASAKDDSSDPDDASDMTARKD